MMRIICSTIGIFLCLIGIVGMLTPIPFGIFIFVLGLLFLIPSTPAAAKYIRWARRKISIFDRVMTAITNKMPLPYRRVLRRTEIDAFDW